MVVCWAEAMKVHTYWEQIGRAVASGDGFLAPNTVFGANPWLQSAREQEKNEIFDLSSRHH
eukprot:scaffold7541_cov131-Skeletonema_menzelii.AAC.3